jgi:hypothetical protein
MNKTIIKALAVGAVLIIKDWRGRIIGKRVDTVAVGCEIVASNPVIGKTKNVMATFSINGGDHD